MLAVTAVTLLILLPIIRQNILSHTMLSVDNNYVQQNHGRDVFQYVEYHLCLAIEVWRHAEFKDDVTLVNIVYDCCSYSKNLTDPSDQSLQIVYLLLFFVTWLKELDDMHGSML